MKQIIEKARCQVRLKCLLNIYLSLIVSAISTDKNLPIHLSWDIKFSSFIWEDIYRILLEMWLRGNMVVRESSSNMELLVGRDNKE